ncbi:MAG: hypothetical protein KGJ96_13125 [Xanthomonadaceae bacterium]|nr:hypothetical protein [Xanthomonadaceae bacterium]
MRHGISWRVLLKVILFAHVSHEVGAALFAIRAQLSEHHLIHARLREAALLDALRVSGQPQPG